MPAALQLETVEGAYHADLFPDALIYMLRLARNIYS
jgi:hypothetical protein